MAGTAINPGSPRKGALQGARGSWSARALRVLAVVLIAVGGLALIDAAITLLWQEPLSALYAKLRQDDLSGTLSRLERAPATPREQRALASIADESARIAFLARNAQVHSGDGSPVGRIGIPRIGVSFVIVNGTDTEALKGGPGVFPGTSFPGMPGTTAIAGHRTTFLAPFRHVDALRPGDAIVLRMPYGRFSYAVSGQRVVAPTDVQAAVANVGYSRLVLSACTPLFSAAKRLLVYASLTRSEPEGPARRLANGALPRPIETGPVGGAGVRRPLPTVLESLDPHAVFPI